MGDFKTKLDFSNNRQVTQQQRTLTALSGATQFGIPFSALTSGPDLSTSAVTSSYTLLNDSTFSGNSNTTVFNWIDPIMVLGYSGLVPITPANSGTTQYTYGFNPSQTVTIDGNTVNLAYTGITFDIVVTSMTSLGGGNFSGSVDTSQIVLVTADPLDFVGRTIWVDVNGITRTQKLIVTDGIEQGGVLTKYKTIDLGPWGLSSTISHTVAHGLGSAFTGVTSVVITVLNDSKSLVTDFNGQSGNYYQVNSTNVVISKGNTFFNTSDYENTTNNRGFITITYKV